MRRITRSPGAQAAVGLLTTGLLLIIAGTFLESRATVAYFLFAAAAFRFYAVFRDLRRARIRAEEDAAWEAEQAAERLAEAKRRAAEADD